MRKVMFLKDYFQIIKPKYIILKLTPDFSVRNYSSAKIAKAIQYTYKSIVQRIHKEEKKFFVETPLKSSFFIDIKANDINFYFIAPERYLSLIKEKIIEVWPKITIEENSYIQPFSEMALKYQLNYKREDALSLSLDKKLNEPLNSILNVLDILKENDRIGVFYNFIPVAQRGWKIEYERTIDKIKNNEMIEKEKFNLKYILKEGMILLINFIQDIWDIAGDFIGVEKSNKPTLAEVALTSLIVQDKKKLSEATVSKGTSLVLSTQMLVLSDSKSNIRKENNAIAVLESYKTIAEDNELQYKKVHLKNFNPTDFKIKIDENKMSVNEIQNLLELPGRDLLTQHKTINKIDTLESQVPEELKTGVISVGQNTYKGHITKAYISNDIEYRNLTLCIIGPTRAGKTTLISNIARDSIKAKESTIIFDFCGNCELSEDVSRYINNVLNIDCSDFATLQGLGYNEIAPIAHNVFETYRCAKTKTMQLITLINTISEDEDLRARMERYLEAASLVGFISNSSIKDVFDILQDHEIRSRYINNIHEEQRCNLEEYVRALRELDEAPKKNVNDVIGTKIANVQGILNRISKLKQNTYMELMLKKDCKNNINLVEEMEKSQLICIKMPEVMFATEQEKDIYCTYWLTKIWGALQVRKWKYKDVKHIKKVNIIFDELYQVPKCQNFLRSKLSQMAKFAAKPIISCHYLDQISLIKNELKAANSSYMLLQGCDKNNFKELKEELAPYSLDDLLNLKRYSALCLLKYSKGWSKFIVKMPQPLKM